MKPAHLAWVIALLLLGIGLRGALLFDIPPGLTHDEAGHGHDAAYVLRGVTPLYFSVGYGREPLYDYLNAGLMALIGPSAFTLRLGAFFWGILALAVTFATARRLFGTKVTLWALAFMAVGFWSLATGRQALRSAMLPVWFGLAILAFSPQPTTLRRQILGAVGLGLALGAAFYTYIPARILWLAFPVALLFGRASKKGWLTTLSGLALAGILATPLFLHLAQNPATQSRLSMLDAPLTALRMGDPIPLLTNTFNTTLAFFWPAAGDSFLAYNLPGRPIFDPFTALLAGLGLAWLLWAAIKHKNRTWPILALSWLALGLAASFITGPAALFTRAIGAQPLIYTLPAVGLVLIMRRWPKWQPYLVSAAIALLIGTLIHTSYDYFVRWGQSPDVRAAYQSTLVTALPQAPAGAIVVSSVYPTVAHDPYIAELIMPHRSDELFWVDARFALLLPNRADFTLLTTTAALPHAAFNLPTEPNQVLLMRPTDLDPVAYFTAVSGDELRTALLVDLIPPAESQVFNQALEYLGSKWLAVTTQPGGVAELLSVWQVQSAEVGPHVPPANRTDMVLFTHVLQTDGTILVQRDALDAPSWQWQAGDWVVQIHQFYIPPETSPGSYAAMMGLYDRNSGIRARLANDADTVQAPALVIQP